MRQLVVTVVNRRDLLPIAVLLLFGCVAFAHLTLLPAFEDEGSQLRWIWRAIEANDWSAPINEGKPLEAWPLIPLVMLAAQPLPAIRALHVIYGMIGAVLTYQLASALTNRLTAFAAGVLFALCPFVVYLERFAHADILMCTAGVWVLLSAVRLAQSATWPRVTSLALALLLAALAKLPVGFIFLGAMPLMLLLMPTHERRVMLQRPVLTRTIVAHLPAALLAVAVIVVAMVRVRRGQVAGFGVQDFVGISLGHYQGIAATIGVPRPSLAGELSAQLTWPVLVLGLIGLAASALLNDWRQRWLIVVGAVPMLAIGWLATFWYSRYLLFALPPLIVAAASGWHSLAARVPRYSGALAFAAFAVCVSFMLQQSARLILDPASARWSALDRFQYFEGWVSGYGYPQAAQFLVQARGAPRMVYALDGHSAYQLRAYLPKEWGKRVQSVTYGDDGRLLRSEEQRLANLLDHAPAWIIVSEQLLQFYLQAEFGPDSGARLRLRKIASFDKPGARVQLAIYEATRS
jgi:hypothetical protein